MVPLEKQYGLLTTELPIQPSTFTSKDTNEELKTYVRRNL